MKRRAINAVLAALLGVMLMVPFVQGGDVEAVIYGADYTAPKVVEQVKPERVYYMNNREVEGYVTVAMLVDEQGAVEKVRIIYRTSTFAVNNAVHAASEWKFEPATLQGRPVKAWVAYNLPFGPVLEAFEDTDFAQKVVVNGITYALK